MVTGFFLSLISLPAMCPTQGENTFVNEELQDYSPSFLHVGRQRHWVDMHWRLVSIRI